MDETIARRMARRVMAARRRLRATAHHESGHAVAAILMHRDLGLGGHAFERVYIAKPEDVADGRVDHLGAVEVASWCGDVTPSRAEAFIVVLLAGPLAVSRYCKRPLDMIARTGGKSDLELAVKMLRAIGGEDADLERLWRRTKQVMRQPGVWPAIWVLAEVLLERGTISGTEAARIVDRVMSSPPGEVSTADATGKWPSPMALFSALARLVGIAGKAASRVWRPRPATA